MAKTRTAKAGATAFIGLGNMGEALLAGALKKKVLQKTDVVGCEALAPRRDALKKRYAIEVVADAAEAARRADFIVLAVKPQDAEKTVKSLGDLAGKLLVSVCAGVTLKSLAAWAGAKAKIVRIMPNTPALVGCGATAYAAGKSATEADLARVEALFGAVGEIHRVADEKLLDAVTGLSASGPAYVFLFLEALADGGVAAGLPRALARALATQTVLGAAQMAKGEVHTGELKDRVASPAGTTIEALRVLEAAGFRSAVIEAVVAATERSRELGG